MSKKLLSLLILLALTLTLVMPSGSAAARGANRVNFSATSENFCAMGGQDPFCNPGEFVSLPNGKGFIIGYQTIMKFTSTEPRWNADCYYTGAPFRADASSFTATGSATCYPTDPQYAGGWWETTVVNVFHPDSVKGGFSGKGYGKLDGLLVIARGELIDGVFHNTGTIIELPSYQP